MVLSPPQSSPEKKNLFPAMDGLKKQTNGKENRLIFYKTVAVLFLCTKAPESLNFVFPFIPLFVSVFVYSLLHDPGQTNPHCFQSTTKIASSIYIANQRMKRRTEQNRKCKTWKNIVSHCLERLYLAKKQNLKNNTTCPPF